MTVRSIPRWLRCSAAAVLFLIGGTSRASDNPPVVVPGPTSLFPGIPCPTCEQPPAPSCATGHCGHAHHKHCKPYVVNLCPGACFGYFQTQWNRWEDVCPHPYQGMGISDAPRPVTPSLVQPAPLGPPRINLPDPKLPGVDPKKSGLPQPQPLPMPGKN